MMNQDLYQPADLTLWPKGVPAKAAECREFPTLVEALEEALAAVEGGRSNPWIITSAGDILAPAWIEGQARDILASVASPLRAPMMLAA